MLLRCRPFNNKVSKWNKPGLPTITTLAVVFSGRATSQIAKDCLEHSSSVLALPRRLNLTIIHTRSMSGGGQTRWGRGVFGLGFNITTTNRGGLQSEARKQSENKKIQRDHYLYRTPSWGKCQVESAQKTLISSWECLRWNGFRWGILSVIHSFLDGKKIASPLLILTRYRIMAGGDERYLDTDTPKSIGKWQNFTPCVTTKDPPVQIAKIQGKDFGLVATRDVKKGEV